MLSATSPQSLKRLPMREYRSGSTRASVGGTLGSSPNFGLPLGLSPVVVSMSKSSGPDDLYLGILAFSKSSMAIGTLSTSCMRPRLPSVTASGGRASMISPRTYPAAASTATQASLSVGCLPCATYSAEAESRARHRAGPEQAGPRVELEALREVRGPELDASTQS